MEATPLPTRFSIALRGYRTDEVDAHLDDVALQVEQLSADLEAAEAARFAAEARLAEAGEAAEALTRTLVLAQRTADAAIAEAHLDADAIVRRAEARAAEIIVEAREEARRVADLEAIGAERDRLMGDVVALRTESAAHRERLRALAATLLASAEVFPVEAIPMSEPEMEIEAPSATDAAPEDVLTEAAELEPAAVEPSARLALAAAPSDGNDVADALAVVADPTPVLGLEANLAEAEAAAGDPPVDEALLERFFDQDLYTDERWKRRRERGHME
jgi:DivIVA domain-containing protein